METPPSARPSKRARIACSACKQKKQRCDGLQPACGNCVKAGRDCTIEDPASRRQLPPNYIEVLEQRIAELEGLLSQTHPDIVNDHIDRPPQQQSRLHRNQREPSESTQGSYDEPDRYVTQDVARNYDHSAAHPSEITTLCMSAASGQMLYFGETSGLALSKILTSILGGVRLQAPGLSLSGARDSLCQDLPKAPPAALPASVFSSFLVDAYFTHVHPMYPFLHRPTFVYWQSQVEAAVNDGSKPDPAHHFFVFMVHAIGALINPALSPCPAESLYASAELYLDQLLGFESLESIQAILCCAMYSMRSTTGVSVWTLSGIALRQCTDLGLHRRSPRLSTDESLLERELQRRVFWVAYNLDRIAAISTGRPFGIAEDDIDAEYPLDLNDEDITENQLLANPRTDCSATPTIMSLAIHNLRLRRIWADMKAGIYGVQTPSSPHRQAAGELKSRLQQWLVQCPRAMPSHLTNSVPYGSMKWYQLTYHHSVILLHRQSLVTHAREDFPVSPEMISIYLECAESGSILCNLYKELYLGPGMSHTWGALHILFLGGLTFLYCLWASPSCRNVYGRDVVSSACTACTVSLVIMAERWPAAQAFRDTFLALSDATQTMLAQRQATESTEPSLPVMNVEKNTNMSRHLAGIHSIGMCLTVEHLLTEMAPQ